MRAMIGVTALSAPRGSTCHAQRSSVPSGMGSKVTVPLVSINAAWLLAATLAHNLVRWTAVLGLAARDELVCAKTIRKTLLAMPGRLTRSARRWTLHLPRGWPWARWFTMALARVRCIPFPA